MWFASFHRSLISAACGILLYFILFHAVWPSALAAVITRILWGVVETVWNEARITRLVNNELPAFKQHFGPYGIRIANKAKSDRRVRRALAEVFETNPARLQKTVEQLEVIDALFQAGMRPHGDEFLLHDLRLKYGKKRLENTAEK
jgi:hypothetical protein